MNLKIWSTRSSLAPSTIEDASSRIRNLHTVRCNENMIRARGVQNLIQSFVLKRNKTHYLFVSFPEESELLSALSTEESVTISMFPDSPKSFISRNLSRDEIKKLLITEESVIEAKHPIASWDWHTKWKRKTSYIAHVYDIESLTTIRRSWLKLLQN